MQALRYMKPRDSETRARCLHKIHSVYKRTLCTHTRARFWENPCITAIVFPIWTGVFVTHITFVKCFWQEAFMIHRHNTVRSYGLKMERCDCWYSAAADRMSLFARQTNVTCAVDGRRNTNTNALLLLAGFAWSFWQGAGRAVLGDSSYSRPVRPSGEPWVYHSLG